MYVKVIVSLLGGHYTANISNIVGSMVVILRGIGLPAYVRSRRSAPQNHHRDYGCRAKDVWNNLTPQLRISETLG